MIFFGAPPGTSSSPFRVAAVPVDWNVVPNGRDVMMGTRYAPSATHMRTVVYRRYSRGFGGIAGVGSELALSNSWALTTEISGFRDHLNTYRLTGNGGLPNASSYWVTAVRYSLGVKFNPVRMIP